MKINWKVFAVYCVYALILSWFGYIAVDHVGGALFFGILVLIIGWDTAKYNDK